MALTGESVSDIRGEVPDARTPTSRTEASRWHVPAAVGLGALGMVIAGIAMQVWGPAMNDPDSMSSVLYFQRIVGGDRLEVFNLTTPKPLLTLLFGLTWNVVHDWRAIVAETLLAYTVAVAAGSLLAFRVGGAVAGAFFGVALICSSPLLVETAHANSLVWALAAWCVAGLAVTGPSRSYLVAGIALLVAACARPETFIVVGPATVAIGAVWLRQLIGRAPTGAPRARELLPITIAWVALPIQLGHDLLLTGDPLFWIRVPEGYTRLVYPGLEPVGVGTYVGTLGEQFADDRLLVGLALLGAGYMAWQRRWSVLLGVTALSVGVLALLGRLALQGTFIDQRYYEPPKLAVAFGAAVGLALLADLAARALDRWRITRLAARAAGAAIGALLAVAVASPIAPLDETVAEHFGAARAASANVALLMPDIKGALATATGPPPVGVSTPGGYLVVDPEQVTVFVPRSLQRRVAIEADASLTRIGDNQVTFRATPPGEVLRPGQFIYHDENVDRPLEAFADFETLSSVTLGQTRLVVLQASPGRGLWWLRVEAAE